MYFPDLSPYGYAIKTPLPNVLNVGWLDRSIPFSKGPTPTGFSQNLRSWFATARVNPMRGVHECGLCRTEHWPPLPLNENPSANVDGRDFILGNWEIWIPSAAQTVFASPALIIHYVETHGYLPPEDFVAAVMDIKRVNRWNAEAEFERHIGANRPV